MYLRYYVYLRILLFALLAPTAAAVPVQMALGPSELGQCGASLLRKAQTLTYTCELSTPVRFKNAKLKELVSPKILQSNYGGLKHDVLVEVSSDAKVLSLTTSFDATGLDLELSKFNDDFFAVYAQAAHTVISDALKKQSVKMEVLESKP